MAAPPETRQERDVARDLLRIIVPLATAFTAESDLEGLAERIVTEAQSVCDADAGFLFVRTADGGLRCAVARDATAGVTAGGTSGVDVPFPPLAVPPDAGDRLQSLDPVVYAALHGRTVHLPDVAQATGYDMGQIAAFDQHFGSRTVSSLIVPFVGRENGPPAVLQLLNARDVSTGQVVEFDAYATQMAEALVATASVALGGQLLLQREKELLKYERDIQIGRQIQQSFLPATLPQAVGWEISARLHPARDVAGDFYDAFMLSNNRRIALVIADVCDKGVGAALFMALIRSLLRAYSQQHYALRWMDTLEGLGARGAGRNARATLGAAGGPRQGQGSVDALAAIGRSASAVSRSRALPSTGTSALENAIGQTNSYIVNNHADLGTFATTFFGVLDPGSGTLIYVNGGHNPPILVGPEGVKARLMPTGPAVGVIPNANFRISQVQLEPGDTLVAFTDGITDARDPGGVSFTEARLVELAVQAARSGESAEATLERIDESVLTHIGTASQFDDITMLAARRLALPAVS